MRKPVVSVVIPAYNEEKLIGKCLENLMKQTLSHDQYEIIVCDNNSTDKTVEIAKKYPVRIVEEKKNQGFVYAKMGGAAHAKGEYIAFMDSDSTADIHWLERGVELLKNPKLVCVGGTTMPSPPTFITSLAFVIFDIFAQLNQLIGISLLWTSGMIIKKDAFESVGGFKEHMKTGDDWDLTMRLQRKFGRFSTYYTKQIRIYTYPRKQNSLSAFIPYAYVGVVDYITIHILRISFSFNESRDIR
jgi:glycosyltransferase involved in cell wall biosynthesis